MEERFPFKPTVTNPKSVVKLYEVKRLQSKYAQNVFKEMNPLARKKRMDREREKQNNRANHARKKKDLIYISLQRELKAVIERYDGRLEQRDLRRHDPAFLALEKWVILITLINMVEKITAIIVKNRNGLEEVKRLRDAERIKRDYIAAFLAKRKVKLQSIPILIIWRWYQRWKTRWRNRNIEIVKRFLKQRSQFAFIFKIVNRISNSAAKKIQRCFRKSLETKAARIFVILDQLLLYESYLVCNLKLYFMILGTLL